MANDEPIVEQNLVDGLNICSEVLQGKGVAYAVIGGMAAGFRSQPRFTKDVDFLLRVPQLLLPGILESLVQRGFHFDLMSTIREWTQHHMVSLSYHGIPIDWMKPTLPIYSHALDRATEEQWLNRTIRVASVEGLILLKLLAFRTQDQLDIENLVAAHVEKLDLDWVRSEWQTVAPLDDMRMLHLMAIIDRAKKRFSALS